MDLMEQKQGILMGIGLTLLGLYVFGFFHTPSEVKQVPTFETVVDRPIDLSVRAKREKVVKAKEKKIEKGHEWGVLTKMKKPSPVAISAKVSAKHDKIKEDANKKQDNEKQDEEEKNANKTTEDNTQGVMVAHYDPHLSDSDVAQPESSPKAFGGGIGLSHRGQQESDPTLKNVDQWIDWLSNAPSWGKVENFISAYRSQEVLESVFYSVIEALIESPHSQVRHYGFLALSSVPDFKSFQLLVRIASVKDGLGNQERANKDLQSAYVGVHHLPILSQALDSTEDNMKLKASIVAEISAKKNLKNISNPNTVSVDRGRVERRPINGGASPHPLTSPRTAYENIANKLEYLATNDSNAEVQASAGSAARTIHNLLLRVASF